MDIEGTTSSISFVYDVMFPFVRRELDAFLDRQWGQQELAAACDRIAQDAGYPSLDSWSAGRDDQGQLSLVRDEVLRLMAADTKATGLKQLQGLIWRAGFESGELRAHLYDDVVPALERWQEAGLDLRVYSSGSVAAQRLFFGHTICGDLLGYFRGHYDTTVGAKTETESYSRIVSDFGLSPADVLFVSDVVSELDAAKSAGLQTLLSTRPGNPATDHGGHPAASSFDEIVVTDARTPLGDS